MILRQTRINGDSHFSNINPGTSIRIRVDDVSRFQAKLTTFGFSSQDGNGTTILPAIFNRYSRRNAEQYFTIDRSKPKEKYYQTLYWTRHEWAGRDETREVTEFVDISRERYHRDYHLPFSVSFSLIGEEKKNIVSELIVFCDDNKEKIINTVNMVLGLFGECEIDSGENINDDVRRIRLDWDILPPGKYPWEKVKEDVEKICQKSKRTQREMMLRNCDEINKLEPDFIAYGRSGFRGYVIFGFPQKNIYILESVYPDNATYVFEQNWEELSRLTKAEILNQNLHKARIIHNKAWKDSFDRLMSESA